MLINAVPIACINQAAITYHVPATLIISVLKTENGHPGQAVRNTNGSYDYGPMQINSTWLPTLQRAGYSLQDVQYNGCKNVMVGSWILSQQIAQSSSLWTGVGDYHSHTPSYNAPYQQKVANTYFLLQKYLAT